MKNIFVLPTDKPSRLGYLTKKGKEVFNDLRLFEKPIPNILDSENQNIYITSDENGKHGEWVYWEKDKESPIKFQRGEYLNAKKIILTTDQDLIADGITAIEYEFLEWFVQNPSCEEVDVVKGFPDETNYGYNFLDYKIIIPKEKPTIELKDGNQLTHQFEEWNAVFELQSQCRKLGLSELEMHSVLSNKFELKQK